ncbi:hypothetical protein [Halogeometricum limi]|nr:hypothetical protein [Halogeometricum limi]
MQLTLFLEDARKWAAKRIAPSKSSSDGTATSDEEPTSVSRRLPPGNV